MKLTLEPVLKLLSNAPVTGTMMHLLVLTAQPLGFAPTLAARRIGVSTAAVTGASERLVALGYIERSYSQTDRRSLIMSATPLGREFVDKLERDLAAAQA